MRSLRRSLPLRLKNLPQMQSVGCLEKLFEGFCYMQRVTFVVLDEADRMFDYGFEPQISSILRSTRLDRQTCLFSATFPSHIECTHITAKEE